MKKLFTLIAATILCVGAQAQTVNIHLKNGQSFYYSSDSVEYVNFNEDLALDGTVLATTKVAGLTWFTANLGATEEWEPGKYYRWSENTGYTLDDYRKGVTFFKEDYNNGKNAVSNWRPVGMPSDFRVPTFADFTKLIEGTTQSWGPYSPGCSVTGVWFTDKSNGNRIFFPAVGFFADGDPYELGRFGAYWASKDSEKDVQLPNADNDISDDYAQGLFFGSDTDSDQNGSHWRFYQAEKRWYGLPIRPCKN